MKARLLKMVSVLISFASANQDGIVLVAHELHELPVRLATVLGPMVSAKPSVRLLRVSAYHVSGESFSVRRSTILHSSEWEAKVATAERW